MGASGVQIGTRFVATYERDAHDNFKNTYVNAKKDDIVIVKSPVGLPGGSIRSKCYNRLIPWKPKHTPYCISLALINEVKGNVDDALLFCGADVYKINSLSSVKEVINDLTSEI